MHWKDQFHFSPQLFTSDWQIHKFLSAGLVGLAALHVLSHWYVPFVVFFSLQLFVSEFLLQDWPKLVGFSGIVGSIATHTHSQLYVPFVVFVLPQEFAADVLIHALPLFDVQFGVTLYV